MSVPRDRIEELLESETEIPDDPVEIERLLNEQAGEIADDDEPETKKSDSDDTDKPDGDDKPDEEAKPADADLEDSEKPSSSDGPPEVVLRETRKSLHVMQDQLKARDEEIIEKNDRIDKLEGRVAQLASASRSGQDELQDKADELTDDGVKLSELTDDRMAEIREEAGDEVADQLIVYQKQFSSLNKKLEELETSNQALASEREAVALDSLQSDIDSVPLLAVLHAQTGEEAEKNWARAVAYEKAVRGDPDWADKSRRDVYAEVGRKMGLHLGETAVKSLLGDTADGEDKDRVDTTDKKDVKPDSSAQQAVDEALKDADDAAQPTSLSDLPAGQAAPQNEYERAQAISITDLEDSINKAFEKGGDAEVDLLLGKMLSIDSG